MITESAPQSSRSVVVHRVRAREPWAVATFLVLLTPVLALAVVAHTNPWLLFIALFGGAGLGAIPLILAYMLWQRASKLETGRTPYRARATRQGLLLDGGRSLLRDNIVAAFVSPSWPNGAYVRVHRRLGWPVELWTADVEGAHALVAGLGLDASRVAGIATGASVVEGPFRRVVLGASLIALAWMLVTISPLLGVLAVPLAVLFGGLSLLPQKYVVGNDGVLLRALGRRIGFIPIKSIASVEQVPGIVRLRLHDGRARDLVISRRLGDRAATIGLQVGILAERIRAAMRRAGTLEIDATTLERGEHDVESWVATLRELARGSGYRAAVQREDLVYLVEDARRPPRVRVAAAVALGEVDPYERARLRIAAESSSMPEVRDALDAVLAGDEKRLCATLDRVE